MNDNTIREIPSRLNKTMYRLNSQTAGAKI